METITIGKATITVPEDVKVSFLIEPDMPFEDASFYDPSTVAMVERGDRRILIDVAGDVRMRNNETGEELWTADQLMHKFSDGDLDTPLDDGVWSMENNRWFEYFMEQEGYDPDCILGEVDHDYSSALGNAIDYLYDDELWG